MCRRADKGPSPVLSLCQWDLQRVYSGKSVSAKFLCGHPFPLWPIVKHSELGRLLFVWCMGILVALVHQATFQTLTAQGYGGGRCVSPNGFHGRSREQASAQIGLNRWPRIPCMV